MTLLGGFFLRRGGDALEVPQMGQRVLAFLALIGETARPVVAGRLWPEVPQARAAGNLRTTVWRLHRACPGTLLTTRDSLRLTPAVQVDVVLILGQIAAVLAGKHLADGADSPGPDLVMHDLLPGWYDEWVLFERDRLCELRVHALEALSAHHVRQRRYGQAMNAALQAVRLAPLRETAHCALIDVELAEGNLLSARHRYDTFRRLMSAEGIQPSRPRP